MIPTWLPTASSTAQFHQIIVARLYRQYLHRAPDAAGLAGWSAELDSGALTFDDLIIVDLLASDEHLTLHGSD